MTTVDERTDEEIAIDKLDLMMVQVGIFEVGVTDIDVIQRASDCVVQRLESENIEFTGEGTAELIWP